MNELSGMKNIGDNIVTTLDVELQQTASAALGDRKGAVIVMEPDTGNRDSADPSDDSGIGIIGIYENTG